MKNDVAKQRESACPVIGQSNYKPVPLNPGSAQTVIFGQGTFDNSAMGSCEPLYLLYRHGKHPATRIWIRSTKRQCDKAAWFQQRDQFPKRSLAVIRTYVHPNGVQKNEIKGEPKLKHVLQPRQTVFDPANVSV